MLKYRVFAFQDIFNDVGNHINMCVHCHYSIPYRWNYNIRIFLWMHPSSMLPET